MARDVSLYVRRCPVCAISKTPHHLPAGKLVPLPIPRHPWSHVGVDFVTDLPNSEGFTCILVAVDRFFKACRLIPLRVFQQPWKLPKRCFITSSAISASGGHCLRLWATIHLPCLEGFLQAPWCLCKPVLDITPTQTARLSGRYKRLGGYLRAYCHDTRTAGTASSRGPSMHIIPQANHHGPHPVPVHTWFPNPLFPWTEEPSDVPAVDHWFRASERVLDSAHVQLQQAVRRHKTFSYACRSNAPVYRPGDKVWLSTQDLRLSLPCQKLSPRYIGPFTIERQINEVTFLLQLPDRYRIHPAFHVSLLKPFSPSVPGPEEQAVPPPPKVLAEPSIYRDPGWPGMMFWISLFYSSSITTTLIVPHPEAVADPFAIVGCQEPPWRSGTVELEEGDAPTLTRSHPLIIVLLLYHRHLSPLIKSTISLHSSRHSHFLISNMHVYLPDSHLYCLLTSCSCVPLLVLPRSCAPPSPHSVVPSGFPGIGKRIDYSQIRPNIHCHYPINHLDSLPCFLSPALVQ